MLTCQVKTSKAAGRVGHFDPEVKGCVVEDHGVEAIRPSHCAVCRLPAREGNRIRLHGHGRRRRCLWGPQGPGDIPVFWDAWARRYRCTSCEAVRTVLPPGVFATLRYWLPAIAMAFWAWGVRRETAASVRQRLSPWRSVGASDAERWRSLRRWARRAEVLFELPTGCGDDGTEPGGPGGAASASARTDGSQ